MPKSRKIIAGNRKNIDGNRRIILPGHRKIVAGDWRIIAGKKDSQGTEDYWWATGSFCREEGGSLLENREILPGHRKLLAERRRIIAGNWRILSARHFRPYIYV